MVRLVVVSEMVVVGANLVYEAVVAELIVVVRRFF